MRRRPRPCRPTWSATPFCRCIPGRSGITGRSAVPDKQTESMAAADLHREPRGELSIRTLAMPADTNPYGDIFGGWLLGQMDIAGGIFAAKTANGRTATVAVDGMTFRKPVYVGDVM